MYLRNLVQDIIEDTMKFGTELKETPVNERKILTSSKGCECYKAMIDRLNRVDNRFGELRLLLREVWRKHEKNLIVNKYDANDKEKSFGPNGQNIWGVYINLKHDSEGDWDPDEESNIGWCVPYHTIFHEFFHNIDYAAQEGYDKYFSSAYENNAFGKTIKEEISELCEKENANPGKGLLSELTYNTEKRHKAALYDIIGGVLNKGKYGCNPNNSEFYNKDKDGKNEKCKTRFLCSDSSKIDPNAANCKYKKRCNPNECDYVRKGNVEKKKTDARVDAEFGYICLYGNYSCFDYDKNISNKICQYCLTYKNKKCHPIDNKCRYRCSNVGNCNYKDKKNKSYKIECSLKDNDWCNKIFGHGSDYWKTGEKFLANLASEAFAHMAAEAIANPEAYIKIKEYLPDSERMFRKILRKMLEYELKRIRSLLGAE